MKTLNGQLLALFCSFWITTHGQADLNFGLGYFGENGTHPGVVSRFEREKSFHPELAIVSGAEIGFYSHPRNHNAGFIEINHGYRRYFSENRWYLEQTFGIGVMFSFYNEDVWHVDDHGNVTTVSSFANVDFMPSINFGAGLRIFSKMQTKQFLWFKPKVFWQLPYNNLALPHLAIQVGYTMNIKSH